MALVACFDDDTLRQSAAAHFGQPDLTQLMALIFESRQTPAQHRQLAEYGLEHGRFRDSMVAAMRAFGLHLYSNYLPRVNWNLAGLTHFSMAGGSQLLWRLIHTPQDDEVLSTMLKRRWLPVGIGAGAHDAYDNTRHHYRRAAPGLQRSAWPRGVDTGAVDARPADFGAESQDVFIGCAGGDAAAEVIGCGLGSPRREALARLASARVVQVNPGAVLTPAPAASGPARCGLPAAAGRTHRSPTLHIRLGARCPTGRRVAGRRPHGSSPDRL